MNVIISCEQARFTHVKSTPDPVIFLSQGLNENFEAKQKVIAVFLDLMAAYEKFGQQSNGA